MNSSHELMILGYACTIFPEQDPRIRDQRSVSDDICTAQGEEAKHLYVFK